MKKQNFNPKLLKEELKRFKMLEGYDFYHEEKELPDYDKPLLLGNTIDEEDDEAAADEIGQDLGVDDAGAPPDAGAPQDGPAPEAGAPEAGAPPAEPAADAGAAPDAGAPPPVEPAAEPAPSVLDEPAEDEEEIDVTALVNGSKDAKKSADKAQFYSSMLLKKLDDLEKRVGDMDKVTRQIDDLEAQFKLRNPTPNEKLEMQSVVSGPYTQKLSDYWSEKEGAYDVMDVNKKKEYVLTKQNLEQGYSEPDIKKSFDVEYEEENN